MEFKQTDSSFHLSSKCSQTRTAYQEIPSPTALKYNEFAMIRDANVSRAIKYYSQVLNVGEGESGAEKSS